jgi:lysophospholipase L1-like esterase
MTYSTCFLAFVGSPFRGRRGWDARGLPLCGLLLVVLSAAVVRGEQPKPLPFASGERILILGDSITQDGRYVDLLTAYLWAAYPERDLAIFNAGLSSETVSGITEPVHPYPRPNVLDRVKTALAISDPDWVLVCYGMNDGIYHPIEPRIREAYADGMRRLLSEIAAGNARAILLTPPVFDAEAPAVRQRLRDAAEEEPYGYRKPYVKYDATLEELSQIARGLESDPRVERVIDVHAATERFLRAAKAADDAFAYGDGVHPPLSGHAAMATAVLVGLGQPEDRVERLLARIAAVRPPGETAADLPADEMAEAFRQRLFARGDQLNGLLRKATDPETSRSDLQPLVRQIKRQLTRSRAQLRQQMPAVALP